MKKPNSLIRDLMIGGGLALALLATVFTWKDADAEDITVYKSPTCGCCTKWVDHLQENGFSVEVHEQRNMTPIKEQFGVERRYQSCHTAVVEGYIVEGHVPADDIRRLLAQKPAIKGLAVPGMPMGSPGMEGHRVDRYNVLAIEKEGGASVYSSY